MNGHDWGSTAGRGRPSRHIQWVPVVRTSRHDAKLHSQQNLIVLRSTKVKTEWNWCSVIIVNDFLCHSHPSSDVWVLLQARISEITGLNVDLDADYTGWSYHLLQAFFQMRWSFKAV